MKRYFVTGIGTGVGKTLASAVLTEALQADYWKPVQTGALEDGDRYAVKNLLSNTTSTCFEESYWFREPASPHLAASLEQQQIDEANIILPESTNTHLIIEGAGGLLVPLRNNYFVIDLAEKLEAEIILVCRSYLGCINHTLLSIDYLLRHNFKLKGLILNGVFDPLVRSAITGYAATPVVAEWEEMPNVNKHTILQLAKKINIKNLTV